MKNLLIVTGFLLAMSFTGVVVADDDDRRERSWGGIFSSGADVAPVNNATYKEECGGCHFAFQPGFLPARSWEKIMAGLSDHFGDNAELDATLRQDILSYLQANAADRSDYKLSRRIMRGLSSADAPLRITELRKLAHEHNEINWRRMKSRGIEKKDMANCDKCHRDAAAGVFDD